MNEDNEANKRAWKTLQRARLTETAPVYPRPCFLFLTSLTAQSAGPATAVIRDGDTDEADEAIDLSTPAASMARGRFNPPLYFSKGIFVEIGNNVKSLLLHFLPEN